MSDLPWAIVHQPRGLKPGEQLTVIGQFASEDEAVKFLTDDPSIDSVDLENGRYGIDGPADED
jgi:hypothetical protein